MNEAVAMEAWSSCARFRGLPLRLASRAEVYVVPPVVRSFSCVLSLVLRASPLSATRPSSSTPYTRPDQLRDRHAASAVTTFRTRAPAVTRMRGCLRMGATVVDGGACAAVVRPHVYPRGPASYAPGAFELLSRVEEPHGGPLELILGPADGAAVEDLEVVAHTARLRARGEHAVGVGLALAVRGPVRAVLGLVLAHGGARAARRRALDQHHRRVLRALLVERPDGAGSRVLVGASALGLASRDATARRAGLERVARVGDTLTLLGPAGAVVVCVLAGATAHAAGDGTVEVHEARVGLALPLLAPGGARLVTIRAHQRAHATAMRTELLDDVIRVTEAVTRPRGARLVLVVTEADGGGHEARGKKYDREDLHDC